MYIKKNNLHLFEYFIYYVIDIIQVIIKPLLVSFILKL